MIGINSETALIRRMQRGDRSAMQTAYTRYAAYLTAVCSRYIVNAEDVKDTLQEAFIKIFSAIDRYRIHEEGGGLKAWMARIVVNEALKTLQRSNRFAFIEQVENIPEATDEELETEAIPYSALLEMIQQLPAGYRTVFNLYVFEEKSHKEIAELLGIKENSSASQFHRAKQLLAENIHRYTASHHEG